ncbi:hypothetical protein [Microbacterium karelineae]|uniref:hypothetical protein n=1 Tax=Microbacterium karelineae TaxID=2654283 RepID=UPI0012EAEEC9|nr:hypothetical protein [Microbacterium karelineae]
MSFTHVLAQALDLAADERRALMEALRDRDEPPQIDRAFARFLDDSLADARAHPHEAVDAATLTTALAEKYTT